MADLKNELTVAAYSPPQIPHENLPDRITRASYKLLKDAGINTVYGHSEVVGTKSEKYVFNALDICAELGLVYFVRDIVFDRFCGGHRDDYNGFKPFDELTDAEKADLKRDFTASLNRYINHPAFGGIAFFDEPGLKHMTGIETAKRWFDELGVGKVFYVNMLSYCANDDMLRYGQASPSEKSKKQWSDIRFPENIHENRFIRYSVLLDALEKAAHPSVYSFDMYAMERLAGIEKAVHKSLYELTGFMKAYANRRNAEYWAFLQVGGDWDRYVRVPDRADMALQINVNLAYGAQGLQLFPTCYPNDWYGFDYRVGLFDRYGEKTPLYDFTKELLLHVKEVGGELKASRFDGVYTVGPFDTDGIKSGEGKPDFECVFNGDLPEYCSAAPTTELDVSTDSQLLIGKFTAKNGKKLFYLVNNSVTRKANAEIKFSGKAAVTENAKRSVKESRLCIKDWQYGEGILLALQ